MPRRVSKKSLQSAKENVLPKPIRQFRKSDQFSANTPVKVLPLFPRAPDNHNLATDQSRQTTVQKPSDQGSIKFSRKRRSQTSESRAKKQDLMDWFAKMERQYQVVDIDLDNQLSRLKSSSKQCDNKQSGVRLKSRSRQMSMIMEENSQRLEPRRLNIGCGLKQISLEHYCKPIFQSLRRQIQFQSRLRTFKHKIDPKNKQTVCKITHQKYNVSLRDIELCVQQFDPFVVETEWVVPELIAKELSNLVQDANRHWDQRVYKKYTKQQLNSFFTRLDFERRQSVSLKEMVRELGIQLDLNLRKRDLFRIFNRLSQDGQLTLQSLVRKVGA